MENTRTHSNMLDALEDLEADEYYVERDFPGDAELGYYGADEVPPGHPDALDYQGFDEYGGQPCPHGPHWRHCATCNPENAR